MNWKYSLLALALPVFMGSCKKDEEPEINPTISDVPAIEIISVSPGNITQFENLTFTVKYTDGNGDIGFDDADEPAIFIIDNRAGLLNEFHIQPLAPAGSDIAIEGNLQVVLENVILLDQNNTSETATFSVYLKDRAGNLSNTETSVAVTITE
jgi:hypothetical protein